MEKTTIKKINIIFKFWINRSVINLGMNPNSGGIPPIDIKEIKIIHKESLFIDFLLGSDNLNNFLLSKENIIM